MGDMGDDFRAWDKEKKKKKESNLRASTRMLDDAEVTYVSKNGGIHLIVETPGGLVDFWPSTGLFIVRGSVRKQRGVRKLLAMCKS